MLALHEACARAAGVPSEPAFEAARLGDLRRSALDVSRAATELGFRAQMSLDDGIARTWQWTKEGAALTAKIRVPLDAPLLTPHDLVRPWKRATVVASLVAAVELALLIGARRCVLVAKPLSHAIRKHAVEIKTARAAAPAPSRQLKQAIKRMNAPAGHARPRSHVRIMVLNGNGHAGAAGAEAARLQHLGYKVTGAGNARRQDYASSVVMYRDGWRAEGMRLAKDLGVKVVGPLDGVRRALCRAGSCSSSSAHRCSAAPFSTSACPSSRA